MLNAKNFIPLAVASDNNIRPELTGLHVTPDYTEATDTYRVIRVSRPKADYSDAPELCAPFAEPSEYIMDRSLADKIAKALPKKTSLPILLNAFENPPATLGMATFSVTDCETVDKFSGKKIDGAYPDVTQIIPTPEDHVADVLVDCDYLSEILDACKKFGSPRARLTFNGATKPLTIAAQDEVDGQTFMALLMPVRE